jgi:hypothetical protein
VHVVFTDALTNVPLLEYTLRLAPPTGISEAPAQPLFPGSVLIAEDILSLPTTPGTFVELITLAGQQVLRIPATGASTHIPLRHVAPGLYFYRLVHNGSVTAHGVVLKLN